MARTESFDVHEPDHWVAGEVLAFQARARGERPFLIMDGGGTVTYREAEQRANRVAHGLAGLGVRPHEHVAVMLPNCLEYVDAWLGIARAGAVHVAVNTEYQGDFLRHVLSNCGAATLICHADYLPRIAAVKASVPSLGRIVVAGDTGDNPTGLPATRFDRFADQPSTAPAVEVTHRDIGCIMYTSGTTGPSKGVLMPHAHMYVFGLGSVDNLGLGSDDIYYIVLPLFHANGLFMQLYATLIAGATAIIKPRFSASAWIRDIRHYGATVTNALGVMTEFILNQPSEPADRRHGLRTVTLAPNTPELEAAMRQRFGIANVVGLYGMTEVNIPLYGVPGKSAPGSCGREYSHCFEVMIADPDSDRELPRGMTGEILVRPRQPFSFMAGYLGMPDETVAAWRNLWFHTGDAAMMNPDGDVFFIDRIKDCIRRRGENISSYEIESVVQSHPTVAEAAAVAVKSEIAGGEDEIKLSVVPEPGQDLAAAELIEYCRPRMPAFALPRYIEFVPGLPKTPTNKVQKSKLREAGVTPGTWDRDNE